MNKEKSNMEIWAENEIKIACERENPNRNKGEWDYGCACYESALKAYKCLCEDGHSGLSFSITRQILNRLMEGKPLTPIEDREENWNHINGFSKEKEVYQCKRMSAWFKDIYPDGTVEYNDVDRCACYDTNHPTVCYHSGLVDSIINDIWPITMPYFPDGTIKVYCEDFLTNKKNGDFDTVGIFYAIKSDGTKVNISRFFKKDEPFDTDWVELSQEQYDSRKEVKH